MCRIYIYLHKMCRIYIYLHKQCRIYLYLHKFPPYSGFWRGSSLFSEVFAFSGLKASAAHNAARNQSAVGIFLTITWRERKTFLFLIVKLSDSQNVKQSGCQAIEPSSRQRQTVKCQAIKLSNCQAVNLSISQTVKLSNSQTVE